MELKKMNNILIYSVPKTPNLFYVSCLRLSQLTPTQFLSHIPLFRLSDFPIPDDSYEDDGLA